MKTNLTGLHAMPTLPTLAESRTPAQRDEITAPTEVPCLCSPAWRCSEHSLLRAVALENSSTRRSENRTVAVAITVTLAFLSACAWGVWP